MRRLQPWLRNELSRLIKSPKLHFVDSGLLCAMRGHTAARFKAERALFGPALECLAFSELLKAATWADERVSLFHYRDKDQYEVDVVLENDAGQVVGIQIKAAASLTRKDFAGLDRLAAAAGSRFVQGIVLYDGDQTLSFADHLRAVPIASLWA